MPLPNNERKPGYPPFFPCIKLNEKFHLREQAITDTVAFLNYYNDPKVYKHILAEIPQTEQQAREAAIKLVSKLENSTGHKIKARAQDHLSKGVMQQNDLREKADKEGYAEAHLWTGIGRARSGCGAAIVGNPDQVINTLKNYMRMGFRSFILSGYPHLEACELFAKYVLPAIPTTRLAVEQKRVPQITPETPLTHAKRI